MFWTRVKLVDERRYYREFNRLRDRVRDTLRQEIGRRKYNRLIEKINKKLERKRLDLKRKFREKTRKLERDKTAEEVEKMQEIPVGLEDFGDCMIFKKDQMENLKPAEVEIKLIGDIKIDDDEKSILKLNPKFAILKKLIDTDVEHDT